MALCQRCGTALFPGRDDVLDVIINKEHHHHINGASFCRFCGTCRCCNVLVRRPERGPFRRPAENDEQRAAGRARLGLRNVSLERVATACVSQRQREGKDATLRRCLARINQVEHAVDRESGSQVVRDLLSQIEEGHIHAALPSTCWLDTVGGCRRCRLGSNKKPNTHHHPLCPKWVSGKSRVQVLLLEDLSVLVRQSITALAPQSLGGPLAAEENEGRPQAGGTGAGRLGGGSPAKRNGGSRGSSMGASKCEGRHGGSDELGARAGSAHAMLGGSAVERQEVLYFETMISGCP